MSISTRARLITGTCEECPSPATTYRNICGVLERRCAACTAAAERQQQEDERVIETWPPRKRSARSEVSA